MRRFPGPCCLMWLVVCAAAGSLPGGDDRDAEQERELARWASQLGDESFTVREAASNRLLSADSAAAPALARAAEEGSPEAAIRAVRVLEAWANAAESERTDIARQTLIRLANSHSVTASRQARAVLRKRQQQVIAQLNEIGAQVMHRDEQVVAVIFDQAKQLGRTLRLLHELPDLEFLSFSTPLMDDQGLAEIQGLPRVRELNLYRSRIGDDGLKFLQSFPNLRRVPMGETQVTDAGLVHLSKLEQLEYLGLRGNPVTDAGLAHLKPLKNLTGIYLGETSVTDQGLSQLKSFPLLNQLLLAGGKISDAGLEHLHDLKELRFVDLTDTQATPEGISRLQDAIPSLQVRTKQP